MGWEGYFLYAGQEFINVQRTAEYARHANAAWFRDCYGVVDLGPMLGERYRSPLLDPAPWADPDSPESYDFWGVYPLSVTGIEDSTRQAEVIESILDGGRVGRVRHGTRAVVFSAALVGGTDCAVEYGFRWLKRLLLGVACGAQATEACMGADLCYLSCQPYLDWNSGGTILDIVDCIDPYWRSVREVVINTGPSITSKASMQNGGAAWTVTFTAVAGNPYEFGAEVPIVEQFGKVSNPYVIEPPGIINMNGPIVSDATCKPSVYYPVVDPDCPDSIPPPSPPSISLGCYTPPVNWKRRQFTIPKEYIPLWGDVVPQVRITAPTNANVRNIRLRFYADVDGDGAVATDDPCSYCGDIVVSYIPAGETLVIDGSDELVYVESIRNGKRRADALVFDTNGNPFKWPVLSCGFGYIVAVDMEQNKTFPSLDFSLYPRTV